MGRAKTIQTDMKTYRREKYLSYGRTECECGVSYMSVCKKRHENSKGHRLYVLEKKYKNE